MDDKIYEADVVVAGVYSEMHGMQFYVLKDRYNEFDRRRALAREDLEDFLENRKQA